VSVRSSPARFGAALGTTERDGNAGFNISGLEGNRVLVQVDGVRSSDSFVFGAQAVGRGDYGDLDPLKSGLSLRAGQRADLREVEPQRAEPGQRGRAPGRLVADRLADRRFAAADAYWNATKGDWAAVRQAWGQAIAKDRGVAVTEEAENGSVPRPKPMALAEQIAGGAKDERSAVTEARALIGGPARTRSLAALN
jgi:hypothetical protein